MARKKRIDYSPSFGTILIVAGLALVIGVLLAAIQLFRQSVDEVTSMPAVDKREPGVVYYHKGASSSAVDWRALLQQLIESPSGTVAIPEGAINQWANAAFRVQANSSENSPLIVPEQPNVRLIGDGLVQIGVKFTIPSIDDKRYTYQTKGHLIKRGGVVTFEPMEGMLGRSPLLLLNSYLFSALITPYLQSEDIQALFASFENIDSLEVGDGQLTLSF